MRRPCSGLFWLFMQTHKIPIDPVNVMETSLQSIGRRTQNLLPDEAVHLFIAGEEECFWFFFFFATFVLFLKKKKKKIATRRIAQHKTQHNISLFFFVWQ